ncbi:hypothetical protein J0H58_04650 [bacterium]|nr:hypothetical protein [bacterium]
MSPVDAARLQDVYRRESRSLLAYARSAAPHAAGDDRKLRDDLFRAADEAAAALDGLATFLDASRVPVPMPSTFPVVFTDLNCVAVRYLLPKVVADRTAAAAALDADLAALSDPAARAALQPLLDLARRDATALT